jgi:hypothetical protein
MAKKPDPRTKKKAPRRTRMIALEPRMLFDGALGIDLGVKASAALQGEGGAAAADAAAAADQSSAESTALLAALPEDPKDNPAQATDAKESERESLEKPAGQRTELVFVDPTVSDPDTLLAGVSPDMRVFLLDPARDAIAQIAEVVSQYAEGQIDAIHLIAHGSEGRIEFSSGVLDAATMQGTHAEALAQIGKHLSGEADILVYGCNFGHGEEGQFAAEQLARITGADVAASDDATGHAGLGGDWDLERWIGSIESEVLISPAANEGWWNLLADVTVHSYEPTFAQLADNVYEIKGNQNWGQTFVFDSPAATYSVDKIGLVLYRAAGANNQTITVSLHSTWNGAAIASGTVASSSLGTAEAWVTINLSAAATLNDNTTYYIRVDSSNSAGGVYLGVNQSGTYAGGNLINHGGAAQDGPDAAFRIIDDAAAPVLATGSTLNYTENGVATAINTAITLADADSATQVSGTVSITGNFASGEDVLSFTNVPATMGNIAGSYNAGTGVMTLTSAGGTATLAQWQAALRAVQYSNSSDNPSTAARTVSFTVNDGVTGSNTVASTVNVAAVNDAPVNTVPAAQSVNEDTALPISGVSVNDVEGNLSTTRLTVANGAVTVSLAGGATISAGANGSSTLTLSGTQAQINAALAGLSYQGNLNFNGADTLTVLSTDSNGATDSDTVAITVNPINDVPGNTVPGAQSVNEDTALSIAGISVNDVDGNLSTTRLTVTNGKVTVIGPAHVRTPDTTNQSARRRVKVTQGRLYGAVGAGG